MPLLYRNVGSQSHAWAADNGKLVFGTGGAPSHQRLMTFSYSLGGIIDFAPLYPYWQAEYGFDPNDAVASSIDAALVSDRLRTVSQSRDYTATNGFYNQAASPDLGFGFVQTAVPDALGANVAYIWRFATGAGLVWDAAAWHWAMRLGVWLDVALVSGGFERTEAWTTLTSSNPNGSYALFKSASSATDIRLGANGWDLHFDSIVGNDALPDAAAALQNMTINLSAQYA